MSHKKGNTSAYMSIGTIRVRSNMESGRNMTVFFTPTKDFSVPHGDKKFAALLPVPGNSGCGRLAPYKSEKGIPLNLDRSCADLVEYAIKQCSVEIEIEATRENCAHEDCKDMEWSLLAITIPAASQMR